MFYKYKLGHNTVKATESIHCTKGEVAVYHSTVIKWLKKFCSGCKNLDDPAMSGRPKMMVSKAWLQAIEANPASNIWRVSGELGISQSSMVHHFHDLSKNKWSC